MWSPLDAKQNIWTILLPLFADLQTIFVKKDSTSIIFLAKYANCYKQQQDNINEK